MPYKDPIKQREAARLWAQRNATQVKKTRDAWRAKNIAHVRAYNRIYMTTYNFERNNAITDQRWERLMKTECK